MRSGWLFGAALACCFVLGWGARGATDVRKPVSVTRIYTGSDGLSHAEEIRDIKLMPDAARNGLEASDVIKVTGLRFARTSPGWVRDWHVAERHQYTVTLSGNGSRFRFTDRSDRHRHARRQDGVHRSWCGRRARTLAHCRARESWPAQRKGER